MCPRPRFTDFGEVGKGLERTSFGVTLETQHNLRGSVPPGSNIFGHVPGVLLWIHGKASSKTKVANLELAVGIDQQITGLEISVEHVCRVNVLQTAQDLVYEGLEVCIGKRLSRPDDGRQIAFHELCVPSAVCRAQSKAKRTLVEVALVEVVRAGNVHVVETCYLQHVQRMVRWSGSGCCTLRCPGMVLAGIVGCVRAAATKETCLGSAGAA